MSKRASTIHSMLLISMKTLGAIFEPPQHNRYFFPHWYTCCCPRFTRHDSFRLEHRANVGHNQNRHCCTNMTKVEPIFLHNHVTPSYRMCMGTSARLSPKYQGAPGEETSSESVLPRSVVEYHAWAKRKQWPCTSTNLAQHKPFKRE